MFPYVALLAVPGSLALTGARRAGAMLLVVAFLYWIFIGFRFHVGMDWNNYIYIHEYNKTRSLTDLVFGREPGYGFLTWVAATVGGGTIFLNVVSGLVFCWGFFSVAKRCREPWLAVAIATPLLVVAFAMSGIRQAIACGLIFYLFATWYERSTAGRIPLVIGGMLFHFSAIFVLVFVALASNARSVVKFGFVVVVSMVMLTIIRLHPESMEAYSRLYIGPDRNLTAPGAIVQVGIIAIAAVFYLFGSASWRSVYGDSPLHRNLAWASLILLPAILISSVGAYRLALYLWPMAMYVYSGMPGMVDRPAGQLFYRVLIVGAAFAILIGWLLWANNSLAWLPYKNWLLEPDDVGLIRRAPFMR